MEYRNRLNRRYSKEIESDFCFGDEECKAKKRKIMGGICRYGRRDLE